MDTTMNEDENTTYSSHNEVDDNDDERADSDLYLGQLLCNFLNCTRGEVLLMAMTLGLRHSLTWQAILDLLKMINTIFNDRVVPTSKYFLQKYFPSNVKNGVYHMYCPECYRYLGARNDLENNIHCSCGHIINVHNTNSYFLQFDVRDQLNHFLKDANFVDNLSYRFRRIKKDESAIEDIFDGNMYKKNRLLKDNFNLSYTFNTDGCSAADSSQTTVWPIYMMLHDLPPKERKKYMILSGLWVDKVEPKMNIFLEMFVNQANDLSSIGITWKLGNNEVTSKLIPLVCSVDSVARCKVLNMKQYNGTYGCTFCLHPTEAVDGQRKYTISKNIPPLRNSTSVKISMLEACELRGIRRDIDGVWGPSSLMNLVHFDLVEGMFVDHLHATLLGLVRQFTDILLSSVNEDYYVGAPHHFSKINRRLLQFNPPTIITRTPRNLSERRLWKGSEWQDWLIMYSLICLKGLLKNENFNHLAMLVAAMNILLQDSITQESLEKAEELLIKFVIRYQKFYGKLSMNYVVHLHLHICRSVRNWGPLWAHSTFSFENENRFLLNMKQSPARLIPQMSQRFLSFQKIRSFPEKTPISQHVQNFCSSIFSKQLKFFSRLADCILIGNGKNYDLSISEQRILNRNINSCLTYDKLICNSVRFVTASYHENYCTKSNDSIVLLKSGEIGKILKILKVTSTLQEEVILFINIFEIENDPFVSTADVIVDHIKKCHTVNNIRMFTPADLDRPCLYAKIKQVEYVIVIPYGCCDD
ncbi:uncharacterized protein LOC122852000 isoform X2 [Aphidius gifuensis]|nr:uncharacterized protein LOC122852000 isoform X2 [Aphidius gifuensis]